MLVCKWFAFAHVDFPIDDVVEHHDAHGDECEGNRARAYHVPVDRLQDCKTEIGDDERVERGVNATDFEQLPPCRFLFALHTIDVVHAFETQVGVHERAFGEFLVKLTFKERFEFGDVRITRSWIAETILVSGFHVTFEVLHVVDDLQQSTETTNVVSTVLSHPLGVDGEYVEEKSRTAALQTVWRKLFCQIAPHHVDRDVIRFCWDWEIAQQTRADRVFEARDRRHVCLVVVDRGHECPDHCGPELVSGAVDVGEAEEAPVQTDRLREQPETVHSRNCLLFP